MQSKRLDYISRDQYFMWIAILSWKRSKDPNTQVWACIVNQDKKIVWIWYNWLPIWCNDDNYPRDREWERSQTKYPYIVHAEANAILNSFGRDLKWSTIYVQLFPCNECAKLIIQSWIKKVIYLSDKYKDKPAFITSRKMLKDAWIEVQQLNTSNFKQKKIEINFE